MNEVKIYEPKTEKICFICKAELVFKGITSSEPKRILFGCPTEVCGNNCLTD